jgi:hypothetical protein
MPDSVNRIKKTKKGKLVDNPGEPINGPAEPIHAPPLHSLDLHRHRSPSPHPLTRSGLLLAGSSLLARSGFSSPDLVVAARIRACPCWIELILVGSGGGRHTVLLVASSSAREERG